MPPWFGPSLHLWFLIPSCTLFFLIALTIYYTFVSLHSHCSVSTRKARTCLHCCVPSIYWSHSNEQVKHISLPSGRVHLKAILSIMAATGHMWLLTCKFTWVKFKNSVPLVKFQGTDKVVVVTMWAAWSLWLVVTTWAAQKNVFNIGRELSQTMLF